MKQICGKIKHYDWGVKGNSSLVSKYGLMGNHIESINNDLSYAELWLGTPKNNVSIYHDDRSEIKENLPFLFKFLSIDKPLSIQIHPNKKLAEELHSRKPEIYPDSNHKPEVAIALSKLEALSGLRAIEDIKRELLNYPEIIIEENYFESYDKLINEFINISNDKIIKLLNRLLYKKNLTFTDKLILAINKYFNKDVGILAPIYMTYVKLNKFEALYIKPDTPHVYLKGNIIECMACSDNVIRLALTNKIKDKESLALLNLKDETTLVYPNFNHIQNKYTYDLDLDEFTIEIVKISGIHKLVVTKNSLLVILNGFGLINNVCYIKGSAFLIEKAVETLTIYSPNVIFNRDKTNNEDSIENECNKIKAYDMHIAVIRPNTID